MSYVIGIDSGGTKTEAIAYDLEGQQLARQVTGFGNLLVDYQEGLGNIKTALDGVLAECGAGCQLIVLGLAGIDSSGLKEQLQIELKDYQSRVMIINDGQLAHLALLKGEDGILVISGTGSVSIGRLGSKWYRVGGWGNLFGDEGSGYDIAKFAIQQALSEADHDLEMSPLSQAIMSYLEVTDVMALVKLVYQFNKGQIAELAAVLAELAATEPTAKAILTKAGRALAESVSLLRNKMPELSEPLLIGLNGSVIEKNQDVRTAFFTALAEKELTIDVCQSEESSAKGAYYLFKKDGKSL